MIANKRILEVADEYAMPNIQSELGKRRFMNLARAIIAMGIEGERNACATLCDNRANSSFGKGRASAEWCASAIMSRSDV